MSELVRERGYTPASNVAHEMAQIEQANQQWGRAVTRLRLLEKEMGETFRDLARAEQSQRDVGNGGGPPGMSACARAAWEAFRREQESGAEPSSVFPEPPILNWQVR